MKTSLITAAVAIAALWLTSCTTTETTVTSPDGTITRTKSSSIDPATAQALANAAANAALESSRSSGK